MLCGFGVWPVQRKERLCSAMIHMSVVLSQLNVNRADAANATNIQCAEPGMLHAHMGNMKVGVGVDGVVGASSAAKTDAGNGNAIAVGLQHCSNRSHGV